MSLSKRTISINLAGGIDQSKAPEILEPPALTELKDCRWDKQGEVGKRFVQATDATPSYDASYEPSTLFEHGNQPVVLHPEAGCYVRDAYDGSWSQLQQSAPRPSLVLTDPLIRSNDRCIKPDSAIYSDGTAPDLMCVVYSVDDYTTAYAAAGCYYAFYSIDADGNHTLVSGPTKFGANLVQDARVVVASDSFIVVGMNGARTQLYISAYSTLAGTYTFDSPTAVTTGLYATSEEFDLIGSDSFAWLSYRSAVTTYQFKRYDKNKTLDASYSTSGVPHPHLALYHDATANKLYSADYTGAVGVMNDDLAGGGIATASIIAPAGTHTITRATLSQHESNILFCLSGSGLSITGSPRTCTGTYLAFINGSLTKGTEGYVPTVALAGKAFTDTDTRSVVPVVQQLGVGSYEEVNPQAWLARVSTYVDGVTTRITLAQAAKYGFDAIYSRDARSKCNRSTSGHYFHTYEVITFGAGSFVATAPETGYQVDLLRSKVETVPAQRDVECSGMRVLGGGAGVTCFDGRSYAEISPQPVVYVRDEGNQGVSNGGSQPPAGTNEWCLVRRWRDSAGNVHRSAASKPFTDDDWRNPVAPFDVEYVRWVVARPYLTAVDGQRYVSHDLEVYWRNSTAGYPSFIFVGAATPAVHTDPCLEYIDIASSVVPSAHYQVNVAAGLSGNGWDLYSVEEPDNVPPPAMTDICSTQSRAWGLSAERGRLEVWYTKPLEQYVAPRWSSVFVTQLPNEGGEATAIAALDDKVLVFKRRRIFYLFGNPGTATGSGSTLQKPKLRSSDVGCTDARSVVEGPFGVAFLAESGFHVIDSGMQLRRIGDRVFDLHDGREITSGVLVPEEQEVRWTVKPYTVGDTTIAYTLVWHYVLDQWSLWTSHGAVDACVVNGDYWRLGTAGNVVEETRDDWDGSAVEPILTTAWIKLAGVQGYQRVWRITLLGRWYTAGAIVRVGYDYRTNWVDTFTFTSTELSDATRNGRTQITIRPTEQKCEAFRIQIEEAQAGGQDPETGRGQEWIQLEAEIGVKRGNYKNLASAARK